MGFHDAAGPVRFAAYLISSLIILGLFTGCYIWTKPSVNVLRLRAYPDGRVRVDSGHRVSIPATPAI
jgi:hypothetical protein